MHSFAAKTTLAGILASALAISAVSAAEEIRWASDLAAAKRQATQEGKLILLHFQSQNCLPCRNLEANVFADDEVVAAIHAGYVPVRIDVDEHPEVAEAFQVTSWPTDVIVTATEGEQLYRGVSSQKALTYRTNIELIAQNSQPETVDPALAEYEQATAQPGQASSIAAGAYERFPQDESEFDALASGTEQGPTAPMYAPHKEEIWAPTGAPPAFDPHAARPPEASLSDVPRDPMDYDRSRDALAGTPQFDGPLSTPKTYEPAPASPQPNPYQQAGFGEPSPSPETQFDGGVGAPGIGEATGEFAGPSSTPAIPAGFARPAATPVPATSLRLGLDGNCPVTLVAQNAWTRGIPQFGVKHRGIVYLFADASARDLFLADPDRFSLAWQGIDAVEMVERGRTVPGEARFGVVASEYGIDGVVLFSSEENLARFGESAESVAYYVREMEALLRQPSNVAAGPAALQR